MKLFLKILAIIIVSILGLSYLAFLIIPNFINLDKYKPLIQKTVLDNSKLNLDYTKLKLYSTPLLSLGIKIENTKISFIDNSELFYSPEIKTGIALPSLLTLTIKTAKTEINNPKLNFDIVDDKEYKIVRLIEDIINQNLNNQKPQTEPLNPFNQWVIDNLKIKIPSIKIINYQVLVNDIKNSHNLKLTGENLTLGYNSKNNNIKIITNSKLLLDNKENILANLDINASFLPSKKTKAQTQQEKLELPFVNLVKIYQTYDLKTSINSKLKIKQTKNDGLLIWGNFDVDDFTIKLGNVHLPKSYLHTIFNKKEIEYDTNINFSQNENINLKGILDHSKKTYLETTIKSTEIHLENILNLLKGTLDSFNITTLDSIKIKGILNANASIKTDFKKLTSNGSITIKNGSLEESISKLKINNIIVNLLLDNNSLNIKDTKATINNSNITISGGIDNNSNADIKIDFDELNLPLLYKTFAPKELKKQYEINSANLSAHINIKGKLDNLAAELKTKLKNLKLNDTKKTMSLVNNEMQFNLLANSKEIKGELLNNGLVFAIPNLKTKVSINSATVNIDDKNIAIVPFDVFYNDLSRINVKGSINNYLKKPDIDVILDGKISTQNIKQTLGKDCSYYLNSKGLISLKISIKGDDKKQNILAQIYSDKNNYITFIDFNSLLNNPSLIQADISIENNKIKIKNSGLFKTTSDFSNNLDKIANFNADIENNHIKQLSLEIPKEQNAKISIFKNSSLNLKGKLSLDGYFDNLNYKGNLKIKNISIPELLSSAEFIDLNLSNKIALIDIKKANINSSLLDLSFKTNLASLPIINLSDFNLKSDLIDVDKLMVVLNNLLKYTPPQTTTNKKSNTQANIPLYLTGKIDIAKLISGTITIENIKSDLLIKNNNLYLNDLICNAFRGDIKGSINMNLITQLIKAKLEGENIDSNKLLTDSANLKNTISGLLNFNTNISLCGATYLEQMKSLKGNLDFEIKDGSYGPFAKLENFFLAENIKQNALFKNTVSSLITPLKAIDTTKFKKLTGKLSFNNGTIKLNPITSQGDTLCLLINGNLNLLNNNINANVYSHLNHDLSDKMGILAQTNPKYIINNSANINYAYISLYTIFSKVIDNNTFNKIPNFTTDYDKNATTKFQILLQGNLQKPANIVKSFKWLVSNEEMNEVNKIKDNYLKSKKDKALQTIFNNSSITTDSLKETATNKVIETQEKIQNKVQEIKQNTTQKLQDAIKEKTQSQNEKLNSLRDKLKNSMQPKTQEAPAQAQDSSAELAQ